MMKTVTNVLGAALVFAWLAAGERNAQAESLLGKAKDGLEHAEDAVTKTATDLASGAKSAVNRPANPDNATTTDRSLSIFTEIKSNAALVGEIIAAAPEYQRKLAELRAKRAQACPVATGYDERAAQSTEGRAQLERKAAAYERMTQRHIASLTLMKVADLDPTSQVVVGYPFEIEDSSYHSGQLLAARAYKYGITRNATDLATLREGVFGAYNLMTIAKAPQGRLINPRTGRNVTPRAGLPVRGYVAEGDPLFAGNSDLDLNDPKTYVYEGPLRGLTKTRFVFVADVSGDQTDGLLFGMTAAFEVLKKLNAEPELQKLIAEAVGDFVRGFIANSYKIVDLTGKPTKCGDVSNMQAPNVLIQNLGWLQAGIVTTQAADIKAAYKKLTDKYFGGLGITRGLIFKTELEVVGALLRKVKEPLQYTVFDFNYNLVMLPLHLLVHHETDAQLRGLYRHYLDHFARPFTEDLAVPFFDGIYLTASGRRDASIVARMAAVLRQFRSPPAPFGNPASTTEYMTDFSQRAELRDPLFQHLRAVWDKTLAKRNPEQRNPFYAGGGIWRLGPGLVPRDNNIERANPYALKGYETKGTPAGSTATLREFAGHDYLLNYWYARYHGLL